MPSTRLETSAGWIDGRHAAIADAIQRALVESIRIPEADRDIRIVEIPAEAFFAPPGRSAHYAVLEIAMFSGRSPEAKARLYAALQRELAAFGLVEGDLKVIIHDLPFENWGLRGAPANPATLTFKVDV
ncbi:MAG TPA: tautomerase family protein [Devosia sp.]|jgi:phenylpyruvate tautomerase PptA (4-oxalocrotonate tautomerase family)|nr:tautomerase family protein [Devosia sp.]